MITALLQMVSLPARAIADQSNAFGSLLGTGWEGSTYLCAHWVKAPLWAAEAQAWPAVDAPDKKKELPPPGRYRMQTLPPGLVSKM